ncbi:MAG: hypothetical protein IPM85_15275 [Chitinophagaceae bacterium]|nr:hypothetical protein [Chitinophagaceae bacterium]
MLRFLFLFLAVVHGLIQLLGFVKAFNISPVQQLTAAIPKVNGVLWLLAVILFLIGAVFFFTGLRSWWVVFLVAVILSQYLIFTCWTDAKFGTIANLTILLAVITGFAAWSFYSSYLQDVKTAKKNSEVSVSMLTENDIGVLPPVVQQYVRYTGSLNKPKVINCRIRFCGRIRKDEKSGWMHFASEQNNFCQCKTFLFYECNNETNAGSRVSLF